MGTRPSGISLLTFLYILVGTTGIISTIKPGSFSVFSLAILLVLIASSIGLFFGKKWGWWLISFMTLFSILSKLPIIYWAVTNLDHIQGTGKFYLQNGGKFFVQLLILMYLFQTNVSKYFEFDGRSKLKRVGLLFILVLITFAVFYIKTIVSR